MDASQGWWSFADETRAWAGKIQAAGGGFTPRSIQIADNLIRAFQNSTFNNKLIWLLPLLGADVIAMTYPLRDFINRDNTPALNPFVGDTAFTSTEFNEATGLQGSSAGGSSRTMQLPFKPNQLNATGLNGGIGFWDRNPAPGTNTVPIGCGNAASSNRFILDLRTASAVRGFCFGSPSFYASLSVAAVAAHYYGQRPAGGTTSEFYQNGQLTGLQYPSDTPTGTGDLNMLVMGYLSTTGTRLTWLGRCAVAYVTDGSFTAQEVEDLHQILNDLLIVPTGR